MRNTFKNLMTPGLALVVTAGFATASLAGGPPYDAGYKARGMKERDVPKHVVRTYAAPQATYRNFSYVPQAQANVAQAPCQNATAAPVQALVPQATAGVRRFSYEPAATMAPAPVYRNWNYGGGGRRHTGYGGDYQSKATLYK